MPYGTVKVDNVTFTNNSVDATTTFSGIYASITNNLTLSGTATATTFTGTTANFTNVNAQNISVTTSLSGLAITGGTAGFTTITGTTVTGTTANFATVSGTTVTGTTARFITITGGTAGFTTITGTTVTGTTANFVTVSGTTVTGTTANFVTVSGTSITGGTAGFTTVTGTTVTGTTANFVTLSGTTVTGNIGQFTSLTGATTTMTSGVFALGTAPLPSISFVSDPNTGIYSPGADQVAVATNGTGRLFVDGNGQVSVVSAATTTTNLTVNGAASFSASSNWNFPGLLLRRTASNIAIAKQISFLLDGDTESDTTLTNYLNIWGTYSGPPTTSSTSTGLSASMNLGAPNAFIAHTNGSERLRIDSAGLVGIGTSSPGVTLDVAGTFRSTGIARLGTGQTTTLAYIGNPDVAGNKYITFGRASALTDIVNIQGVDSGVGSANIALQASGGNVGIGTTSPGGKLQISETFATAGTKDLLRLQSESGIDSSVMRIGGYAYTGNARAAIDFVQNAGSNFQSQLVFSTSAGADATERARIDSSGRLLVGTSSARANLFNATISPGLQLEAAGALGASNRFISVVNNFASNGDGGGVLALCRSKGGTVGSNTVVAADDQLGRFDFQGNDGTEFVSGAMIEAFVDGTPGANDMPGRLVFSTTADGASSPTEAMRIKSTGIINFSNAPTHADNTAATAAGLAVGDVYKTVLGVLMIRF